MALPVTITGISTAVAPVGPFKVAAGDYASVGVETGAVSFVGDNSAFATSGGAIAQTFTNGASSLTIPSVVFHLSKTGTPTGNLYAEITQTSHTGTVLATSDLVAESGITGTSFSNQTAFTFTFASPPTIAGSATFGVVLRRQTPNATNYPKTGVGSAVYAGGELFTYNGSVWSATGGDIKVTVNKTVTIASDAYYFFGRDGTTATTLQAFKSTAPDTSWASIATRTGFTTALLNIAAYPVGKDIHFAVQDGTMSSSVATKYLSFDASSDTFLATTETVAAAAAITGQSTSGWGVSLVVRSNGNAVTFYNGLQTNTSGTARARLYYRERTGLNTYGTATRVDANTAVENTSPLVVLGASDRLHFLWLATNVIQRHLTSANALGTAASTGPTVAALDVVSFDNSGIRHVGFTPANAFRWASADNPTVTNTSVTFGTPVRTVDENLIVYALYQNSADGDLYIKSSSDNGATFGSATLAFTGTVTASDTSVSKNQRAYLRGSDYVFPYIVNDGGTLKYNEVVLRSLGISGTMAAPETEDDATFAGDVVLAGVTGELVVAETADDATLTGSVAWLATLAAPETADDATITASVAWAAILDADEAADDATFDGTVEWLPATGTITAPETADDATVSGSVAWLAALAATETEDDATVTATVAWAATLAVGETADDATLDGNVEWRAILAAPETADDATFTGTTAWLATLAAPETADDATFDATIVWLATLDADEAADDATLDGTVAWLAVLAASEAADDATFDGEVIAEAVTGELAAPETADDATFDGTVSLTPATGELDADETADDATLAGAVAWLAVLDADETADDATLDGSVAWVATLAANETADDATVSGSVAWAATLAATETADDATLSGAVAWLATLAASETADDATIAASVQWLGTLAAAETADDATFDGGIYGTGTLGAPETADDATFDGGIYGTGTLGAPETADDATFTGEIVGAGIAGGLDADEAADDATFDGQVTGNVGELAASETEDDATFAGTTAWSAVLAAPETADDATLSGSVAWTATLAAIEAADNATFVGTVAEPAVEGVLTASEAADDAAFAGETEALPAQIVMSAVEAQDGAVFLGKVPERVVLPFPTPRDYGWYERKHTKKLYRKG